MIPEVFNHYAENSSGILLHPTNLVYFNVTNLLFINQSSYIIMQHP